MIEGAPVRAEIARKMGADDVRPPQSQEEESFLGGDPTKLYDVVVECVGRPGMLGQSIAHVKRRGTVVSLGYCFMADAIVPAFAGGREAKLLFPQLYTMKEFRWALEVLNQGAVEPRAMITQTVSLDGLPGAFDRLRGNPEQCKVIVDLST